MDAFFSGIPWQITGWGAFILLAFVVLRAFIKGDVHPDNHVQQIIKDRDSFQKLYYDLRDDYHEREKTTWGTVLAQGATTVQLLESIHRQARGEAVESADAATQSTRPEA